MVKTYTLIFYVFAFILLSCTSSDNNTQRDSRSFVGTWNQVLDSTVIMEFTHDGYYYDSRYNKKSDNFKLSIGKQDGTIVEENFGRLKYKIITQDNDILVASIYGENNGIEFRRKGYIFEKGQNGIIEIVYKMGEGLEDHIQYAVRYSKNGNIQNSLPNSQDSLILILPPHFDKELFYVAFDQNDKDSNVAIINEDRKIYISKDGVNRISLKEDMRVLLDGSVSSYLTKSQGSPIPLFTMQANEWKLLLEKSKNNGINKTEYPIPIDSMVIFSSCRFNPSRKFVNQLFKQTITGNVLGFRYSTIRDELGYLGIK